MKDELIHDNILLMERLKSMKYEFPSGTLEENMILIDKNSQAILKDKFGSGEIKSDNSTSYYFITVNLGKEKCQIKDLYQKSLEAMHRYKWLRKSIINYEYYTEKGGHCHSHMVVDTNKRRDSIIYLLSNFYGVHNNFIDCKRYYTDPINHLNYVKGIKKDKSKEKYMELDSELRDKYNIPAYTDNWGVSK